MSRRCGKHMLEQRGFCALLPEHDAACSKFPLTQGIVINANLEIVRLAVVELERDLRILKDTERNELKDMKVVCLGWTFDSPDGCGVELSVKNLTYIQTHWYTEPHGCAGGDYWNSGEGQFQCTECGVLNRLYERPEVEKLKSYFGSINDKY